MWFTRLTSFNHVFSLDIQKLLHCSGSDYMLPMLIATDATQLFGKCRILAYVCVGWGGVWGARALALKCHNLCCPPVTDATSEQPPAQINTTRRRAELCFWEIGHLHRAMTSKAALKQGSKHRHLSPSYTHARAHKFCWATLFSHLPLIQIKFTLSSSAEILNEQQKWKYFIFNAEQRRSFNYFL